MNNKLSGVTVIKIGGATFGNHDPIIEDIVELQRRGKSLSWYMAGANWYPSGFPDKEC